MHYPHEGNINVNMVGYDIVNMSIGYCMYIVLLNSGPGTFREFQMLLISGPGLGLGDHKGAQEP